MRCVKLASILLLMMVTACGSYEVKNVQSDADRFMELLSRGDANGAFAMCDPNAVSLQVLQNIGNNPDYDEVLDDFQGFEHQEGAQSKRDADDKLTELRLAPTKFKGHEGWLAHFVFRRIDDDWKIIAFKIESPAP